jgi:hypothetical protein
MARVRFLPEAQPKATRTGLVRPMAWSVGSSLNLKMREESAGIDTCREDSPSVLSSGAAMTSRVPAIGAAPAFLSETTSSLP